MTRAPGRVLVISDDAAARGWFSTFLSSMGCQCVATSSGQALASIRREDSDAVLIDLRCSEMSAEALVSEIELTAPHLWGRVLVLGEEPAAPEAAEPTRRQALGVRLRRERLIEELWPTLQPLLAAPPRPRRGVAAQMARIARRVYDSLLQPLPAGVRGHRASSRQLVYTHEQTTVDVVIKPAERSEHVVVLGQILAAGDPTGSFADLPVALVAPAGPVVTTRTNALGEFRLEFEHVESAGLQLRFGEMLLVPLGDMDWASRALR